MSVPGAAVGRGARGAPAPGTLRREGSPWGACKGGLSLRAVGKLCTGGFKGAPRLHSTLFAAKRGRDSTRHELRRERAARELSRAPSTPNARPAALEAHPGPTPQPCHLASSISRALASISLGMLYLLFLQLLKANGCLFPGFSFHSPFFSSFIFCIAGNFQPADPSRRRAAAPVLAAWAQPTPGPLSLSCFCPRVPGGPGKPRAAAGTSPHAGMGGGNGSFCPSLGSNAAPAHGMMGSNQEKH